MVAVKLAQEIKKIAQADLFKRDPKTGAPLTGRFVGRPFYIDYERTALLVADAWKHEAGGIPQGAFLLAYYEAEEQVQEALLLRVLRPAKLPTDSDVISSMVEYYKDNLKTSGKGTQLDSFTRYEFSFSGLECRSLGTFYQNASGGIEFGADVENFYSSHNYSVVKPNPEILEAIVNFRDGDASGGPGDIKIGRVRYSSTKRFERAEKDVPVYVSSRDFLGTRTALFGMTRTGKSNTVKKIIQASVALSDQAPYSLDDSDDKKRKESLADLLDALTENRIPKYPVGQIIFDINGEYANPNLQDAGTAIFELFAGRTSRYSVIEKPGFNVMKVNFYREVEAGFDLICSFLSEESGDYVKSFLAVDFARPDDYDTDVSSRVRYDRRVAAYLCCLKRAGFEVPEKFKVKFEGAKEINELTGDKKIDPSRGISLDEAVVWWETIWANYEDHKFFSDYKSKKGREWADDDLKAILVMLSRRKQGAHAANVSGYIKLRALMTLHTASADEAFDKEILQHLNAGNIVIVDLSQGDPRIQGLYSERICKKIFANAMQRFVANLPNNFIQFYFEEAHNLFPKKDDKDLSQIYNRLAKEGAKLHLGLIYATQEVSSISANILKNTQNWFIAHLNNEDETKELRKYYDFGDFSESLVRFSASSDKGFVRMKTYSNPFVVPVQIDRFAVR
jgi:DNA helicase HerA-like ATPase